MNLGLSEGRLASPLSLIEKGRHRGPGTAGPRLPGLIRTSVAAPQGKLKGNTRGRPPHPEDGDQVRPGGEAWGPH